MLTGMNLATGPTTRTDGGTQPAGNDVSAGVSVDAWDHLDPEAYVARNYAEISVPDRTILSALTALHRRARHGGSMIEIGAGPNLYPLIAAGVHRNPILVTDVSTRNLQYLQHHMEIQQLDPLWDRWLAELRKIDSTYERLGPNLNLLRQRCSFEKVSIFDIADDCYDFASMHFVAESLSDDPQVFEAACSKLIACLVPGGCFAASFMLGSQGAPVGDVVLPRHATQQNRGL